MLIAHQRVTQGWFNEAGEILGPIDAAHAPHRDVEVLELFAHPSELLSLDEFFKYAPDKDDFLLFDKRILLASLVIRLRLPPKDTQRGKLGQLKKPEMIAKLQSLVRSLMSDLVGRPHLSSHSGAMLKSSLLATSWL